MAWVFLSAGTLVPSTGLSQAVVMEEGLMAEQNSAHLKGKKGRKNPLGPEMRAWKEPLRPQLP